VAAHLTHLALAGVRDLDIYVVYAETSLSIPEHNEFVKRVAGMMGWRLRVVKPSTDFVECVRRWGAPNLKRRWCKQVMKVEPTTRFVKQQPPKRLAVFGLKKHDVTRRNLTQMTWMPEMGARIINPLWAWNNRMVRAYLRKFKIPESPIYATLGKCIGDCVCVLYVKPWQLHIIRALYPSVWKKLEEIDRALRGKLFCRSGGGKPKLYSLHEYLALARYSKPLIAFSRFKR